MKLLVCDVEGTIFKANFKIDGTDYSSTMWQPIAEKLGDAAIEEERKTHKKWDNLEYNNYLDWVKATIDIHKKYSLRKKDFEELINKAEFNEGVIEFFNKLNRNEWMPVLISGGFQNLIRKAQNELDIEYGFGACEYFFDDCGHLEHYNIQPSDFDGKIHFLDILLKTHKLNKKTDWVFIGDGKNDEAIAKIAPMVFGINPHEKLKAIDNLIEINSFIDIIPYLEKISNEKPTENKTLKENLNISNVISNDISRLNKMVVTLKAENRKLKQKFNNIKGKVETKESKIKIPISKIDYEKTPRVPLPELLKGIKVAFLGLNEDYLSFKRLNKFKDLRVIAGMKNNIDNRAIKNADFLFIYKNCIKHSDVQNACKGASTPPCCYLGENTNNELISNALANVLYRYIYER
jgi:phosphoserine phosphatase